MSTSFNEHFDQHGAWRREFGLRLKLLAEWMKDHELLDAGVEERLRRLENQVRADKVMVAFVGEFSRGKSELINAIFFAGYGRRIMPASAGRTTMCPTEMGYDADVPPCLRLLPIETRLQPQALMEWRMAPEKWTRVDLDVNDPQQLAAALEMVAQTRQVTKDDARALGLWHNETPEDNPMVDAQGLVQVPRWRHALINIAHPLLKQGLVILDTPGLNAIGAEPELTVSLLPLAQAVVFILGADTGVTKSDLAIWREHLIVDSEDADVRLVVLNKIDTLWDALSSSEQVRTQIERQRSSTAEILGIPPANVIPVSAQKGLVAKVTDDPELLRASCLPLLEQALAQNILGQRQKILGSVVASGISSLRQESGRVINIRRRDLAEQMIELKGLKGKNATVIKHMRARITQEQAEFDLSGAKIHAVRSVHLKLLREVFDSLSGAALKGEMAQLNGALQQKGFKLGIKKSYSETFERLRAVFRRVQGLCTEIHSMLAGTFRQLNGEHGFSLQAPPQPELSSFLQDLDMVERGHVQYLGVTNAFRLAQADFSDRLVRALATRLRTIHEAALADVELWSKTAAAQLDAQLRERRRNFARRIEAIDRIQQATGGLDDRIGEIEAQETTLNELESKLDELTNYLMRVREVRRAEPATVAAALDIDLPAGFSNRVVRWQAHCGRHHLPWQNTRDPYPVWLSEVMLQQTQVGTVLAYFTRFMERLPTVADLARASTDEVLGLWSGLGYYSRARNLHQCARDVVAQHGGRFPDRASALQALPGIGRSTAAAIASLCFGERAAILDANVRRVLARVLGFDADLARQPNERRLWEAAQALLPVTRPHTSMPRYTQGMMDLGATVCLPRAPLCAACPVAAMCKARASGNPEQFPVRSRTLKRSADVVWLLWAQRRDGAVWLQRRPVPGVWAGLYCMPWFDSRDALLHWLPPAHRAAVDDLPAFRHVLTHKDLHLHPVRLRLPSVALRGGSGRWFAAAEWPSLGLPAPVRQLLVQTGGSQPNEVIG